MRRSIKLTKGNTGGIILVDANLIRCIEQVGERANETKTRVVTDHEDWYVVEDYRTVIERMTAL